MLSRIMVFSHIVTNINKKPRRKCERKDETKEARVLTRIWDKNYKNPHLTVPRILSVVSLKSQILLIFENMWKITIFGKNRDSLKNHDFWSSKTSPPKIIKNRLNFALSEKFTYVRNPENLRKITIFLELSKKIKIFSVFLILANIWKTTDFPNI